MSTDASAVVGNGQHKVYLAIPGKQICWGTVTGVVNSTAKHIAVPHNAGYGFSGVEDFNILWADAHNLYEEGRVTHFAMLHGDITPDPNQKWLDILLEIMDQRQASLVSVFSPIKDHRGVTSTGICDLDDHWRPFRRFTIREALTQLPETFSNVDAGYPDRPLLHNTGLWVCDLRKPVFRAADKDGCLDLYFQFPTQAVRGPDGKWMHRRESEDWLFSRDLWLRGVRDTYVTRAVRLNHHGAMSWGTHDAWGSFKDGDEDTADKWRPEQEKKPLRMLQMLEFELGKECNLGEAHSDCPNLHPDRFRFLDTSRELDDDTIVATAAEAYNVLGFTGLVGWIYYNEPLLQTDRMFALMARIKAAAPAARFILWTNGTLIPEECDRFRQFEQIVVSEYNSQGRRGFDRLAAKSIPARIIEDAQFDDRLHTLPPEDPTAPCLRPFVELIFDHHGNTHLCCYDWRGEGTLGNLFQASMADLAKRWRDVVPEIAGRSMGDGAPEVCRGCGHRWGKYQCHDETIVARARRWRKQLPETELPEPEPAEAACP